MQSLSLSAHLHVPVHTSLPFLHEQLCDLQPLVHAHDMISAYDVDIGWSETSFGDNTPSFNVQPISDGEGSTGCGLLACLQTILW